jgi:hypothetical protein
MMGGGFAPGNAPYDPETGFVLFYDYVTGVSKRFKQLKLVYGFYEMALAKTQVPRSFAIFHL